LNSNYIEFLDPWLTQKSSFCPLCKFDCLPESIKLQFEAEAASLNSTSEHNRNFIAAALLSWWPVAFVRTRFIRWRDNRRLNSNTVSNVSTTTNHQPFIPPQISEPEMARTSSRRIEIVT
jgi:hypothetical protein